MERASIRRADLPEDASGSEVPVTPSDDWVNELVAMTRPGMDMELPPRAFISRPPPFVFDDFS